jgi:hypothetical protein
MYVTKSEPHSKGLEAVYKTVLKTLKDDSNALKVAQKLLP